MRFGTGTSGIRLIIAVSLVFITALGQAVPVASQEASTPDAATEASAPCQDGRLRIRDLEAADTSLPAGLEAIQARAESWQQDARLVELRLACPLLETGLAWEGTFFSETAQANYATGTAEIEPSEEAPEEVPYLSVDGVSFLSAYRSLLRAGFTENLLLAPASSVTVRLSTEPSPFGPSSAPRDVVFVHVAVEERGQIKDVWINATDGTIYRYEMEE